MVADLGNLKGASEVLHKTQSAISQGIKQLEAQLGLQIFNRESYRLELTAKGQQIFPHIISLLNEASEITQISQYLASGYEGSITLAIEASYDLTLILPVLEKTQNEFPGTQIIIKQEYLSGAFEAIENDMSDLAITPVDLLNLESGLYEYNWLYHGSLVNVAAPHLIERHPKLQYVAELLNEYQIVVQDSGVGSKGKIYSVQPGQRCWYANDFNTKKTLIMSGMGWGRLPEKEIEKELNRGDLVKLNLNDLKNAIRLDYYALKLKSRVLGPVAAALWNNLLQNEV